MIDPRKIIPLLFVCATAFAEPPVAVVTGPSGGVPGDLLVLDASESTGEHFAWTVFPRLPDGRLTILAIEGGRKAIVASVPGQYTVVVAVSNAEGVTLKEHVVTVQGDRRPDPDPDPRPEPDPVDPSLPDGRFGLSQLAFDWAAGVDDASKAADLAGSFRGLASQVAAGTIRSVEDLQRKTVEQNRQAVGDDREAWTSWFVKLQQKLQSLNQSGDLKSLADHQQAWQEIATGLDAVK